MKSKLGIAFIIVFLSLLSVSSIAASPAPKFSLAGQNGQVSLSQFAGQVVYVDFWASWCGPCRKSFPWMNEMLTKYKELGFKIIAINLDKERKLASNFLQDVEHKFLIAFDPEGEVAAKYNVQGMPSSYLIDSKGNIQYTHMGFRQDKTDEIESQIKSLLKESGQ